MSDLIDRQAAIDDAHRQIWYRMNQQGMKDRIDDWLKNLPTIQPERTEERTETHACDLISRSAAIDALNEYFARIGKLKRRGLTEGEKAISLDTVGAIKTLPPAQPEVLACGNGELVAQPESTDIDAREAVYNLAEKIGIHQLYALTVELRGEPIQPEPKEGHWINGKCDLCGEHAPFWCMASTYHESNYCPNCGARMTISTK